MCRLAAEAEILANIKHPYIIALVGACLEAQHHVLLMELASNGDLRTWVPCGCWVVSPSLPSCAPPPLIWVVRA